MKGVGKMLPHLLFYWNAKLNRKFSTYFTEYINIQNYVKIYFKMM